MKWSEHMHVHPNSNETDGKVNVLGRSMTSSFQSNNAHAVEGGNNLRGHSEIKASVFNHGNSKVLGGSLRNQTVHAGQLEQSAEGLVNEIDDDDLLKVICFTFLPWWYSN